MLMALELELYYLCKDAISIVKDVKINPIEDTISVLVMGIDDDSVRQLGSARTDALIYLTINTKEHKIQDSVSPHYRWLNRPIRYGDQLQGGAADQHEPRDSDNHRKRK